MMRQIVKTPLRIAIVGSKLLQIRFKWWSSHPISLRDKEGAEKWLQGEWVSAPKGPIHFDSSNEILLANLWREKGVRVLCVSRHETRGFLIHSTFLIYLKWEEEAHRNDKKSRWRRWRFFFKRWQRRKDRVGKERERGNVENTYRKEREKPNR